MNFNEHNTLGYDWDDRGVYVIELSDYVEGGEDGVSNRQAKELTARTRNLHQRIATAQDEIDTLQEQTPIRVETALRSAKTYADGKDTVLRSDMAIADTAAVNAAKAYAEQVVAALVDNSPEALNTLQELAKALGGDPNFATTVMQAIGERMKTVDVNSALAGKANSGHTHAAIDLSALPMANYDFAATNPDTYPIGQFFLSGDGINGQALCVSSKPGMGSSATKFVIASDRGTGNMYIRVRDGSNGTWSPWRTIYHSGNLTPATPAAPGLMSKEDKAKLDGMTSGLLAGYRILANGVIFRSYGPKVSTNPVGKPRNGHFTIYHNIGNIDYIPIATAHQTGIDGGGRGVWLASIIDYGINYVTVATSDSTNGVLQDVGFNLILMQ